MSINLADYAKVDRTGGGTFIKFERTGEVRYLRFLYTSGGDRMGEDVVFYRKYWDPEQRKYIIGGDKGQLVAALKAIEYDEDGSNPRLVRWERSAYFCKTVLLPMWRNYPRIIDGVWKITATSPRTLDATYSIFPVIGADTIKYPIIEEFLEDNKATTLASNKQKNNSTYSTINSPATAPEPAPTPSVKKKYWE